MKAASKDATLGHKTIVMACVEIDGEWSGRKEIGRAFVGIVKVHSATTFKQVIEERVHEGSTIWTDGHASSGWLAACASSESTVVQDATRKKTNQMDQHGQHPRCRPSFRMHWPCDKSVRSLLPLFGSIPRRDSIGFNLLHYD